MTALVFLTTTLVGDLVTVISGVALTTVNETAVEAAAVSSSPA